MTKLSMLGLVLLAALLIGSTMVGVITLNELYKNTAPKSCEEFLACSNFIWLPKNVSNLLYGDRINLHFHMVNGHEISVNGIVEKGAIKHLKCGRAADYDFEVWMSDVNAIQLATSTKPITTFVTLWRAGQIKVQPNGKENERKLAYADQLVAQDNEPVPEWIRNIFRRYIE